MNKDIAKGKWQQMKGQAQQEWGKLTNDELDRMEGNREELAGKVQERYGIEREEAKKQVDKFFNRHN